MPAESISSSFWSCASGTKLVSVSASSTSGRASRRAATASASSSVGSRTSTTCGEVSGSAASALKTRIDSLWGSLRFKGLKSKVTAGRARSEATPASAATATVRPGLSCPGRAPAPGPDRAPPQAEHGDQRRQEGEAERPGDRHAGGGDDAELGETSVVGGSEREKAEAGAQRAQRQRSGDACDRRPQRRRLALAAAERLLKAQHHVNAEIDAEANEQDRKGHRDQIEAADGQGRETRGEYQTDRQGKQRGHAQPGRPQAPDQQRRDRERCSGSRQAAHPCRRSPAPRCRAPRRR